MAHPSRGLHSGNGPFGTTLRWGWLPTRLRSPSPRSVLAGAAAAEAALAERPDGGTPCRAGVPGVRRPDAPPRSSTWTTPSCRAPRSSTSAAGLYKRKFFHKRDLLRFAWQQAYFRLAGSEDPEHMQDARDSALSIVKGHRVEELMSIGEEIYDEYMAEQDLARHPRPRAGPPRRGPAGLAGHRRPGGDRHDHRPPPRADRRARHRRRVGGRRLHRPAGRRTAARPGEGRGGQGRSPPPRTSTCRGARRTATRSNDIPMLSLVGHPYAINPDAGAAQARPRARLAAARLPHRAQGGHGSASRRRPGVGAVAGGAAAAVALQRRRR